jgi:endonuclease/exonuclease/phosphatase family metal-dependent hydrolase
VHIYYGEGDAGLRRRNEEIRRETAALAARAKSDSDSDADSYFIALGDFNIVGRDHETMQSLQTNDFEVPAVLQEVPGSNVPKDKFYDQIAVWTGKSKRRKGYTRIHTYRAGVFDYFETVFKTEEEAIYRPRMKKLGSQEEYKSYSQWRTHQMSDHLPMWIELRIDFSNEYLDTVNAEIETRLQP